MLNNEDIKWLALNYPDLQVIGGVLSGTIRFSATYNDQSNSFLILNQTVDNTLGGIPLSGVFRIKIQERVDKSLSSLPALFVEGVDPIPDRHFGKQDHSACLCSPFEEDDFLQPQFDFRKYFEQLVIPFLYGQQFYSYHKRWPWFDYAHGATGLLQSYGRIAQVSSGQLTGYLKKLAHDRDAWPKIKSALMQKSEVKGHSYCFCIKGDKIRRCHPDALPGIQKLRQDIKNMKIDIASYGIS